jgi:dolichyl-phosphate-mannose-protein mannosyltransferase
VAAIFLGVFFATLGDYGITWDEAENFYIGDRNLQFFTSFDRSWVTFPESDSQTSGTARANLDTYGPEIERFHEASRNDFRRETHTRLADRSLAFGWPYPPVANTASALTETALFRWTGLLDPTPAHHAAIGLMWAVLLIAIYRFTWRLSGHTAALVAVGVLAVAPRVWGPVHNNVKDVPLTALVAFTLIALFKGVSERRSAWLVGAAALGGLAMGTKLNGAFVFLIGFAWLIGVRKTLPKTDRRVLLALTSVPFVAAAAFFVTWPYLWSDPLARLGRVLRYAYDIAITVPEHTVGYGAVYAFITTPITVVALSAIGLVSMWRHRSEREDRPALLLALWLAVPIVRVSLPGTGFYDGIRQYMEYWPALAIVSGLGAARLAQWIAPRLRSIGSLTRRSGVAAALVAVLALTPLVVSDLRLHPYEDAYFSEMIGGLRGARSMGIEWASDYWGNSYLEAVGWANGNLERGAIVIAPIAGHLLAYNGLRPDIAVQRGRTVPVGRPAYLIYITREDFYPPWLKPFDARRADRVIGREGVPLLKIYKLDTTLTIRTGEREQGSTAP